MVVQTDHPRLADSVTIDFTDALDGLPDVVTGLANVVDGYEYSGEIVECTPD